MSFDAIYDTSQLHPDDLTGVLVSEDKMCGIINRYPIRRTAVPYYAIEMYKKNNRTFRVYVKDADLNVINITGAVGIFTVKQSKDSTTTLIQKSTAVPAQGQIGAADEGEMFFYFVPADTLSLDARQYVFDVKITLSTGKVYTIAEGVIDLLQTVG